ncbi:hypothetical protein, partial [Lactococcus petauri]|uniref:hypothetical protein n=1 Tax=Lactococcus petauri TaxID=1940789 RepID=UPI0021F17710
IDLEAGQSLPIYVGNNTPNSQITVWPNHGVLQPVNAVGTPITAQIPGPSGYSGYSGSGISGYSGQDGVIGSLGESGYSGQ